MHTTSLAEKGEKKLGRAEIRNACLKVLPGYVQQDTVQQFLKSWRGDLDR